MRWRPPLRIIEIPTNGRCLRLRQKRNAFRAPAWRQVVTQEEAQPARNALDLLIVCRLLTETQPDVRTQLVHRAQRGLHQLVPLGL